MKKKLIWLLVILGVIAGGAYYWNWKMLHPSEILSEPDQTGSGNEVIKSENRINILVLGSDTREGEAARTDSIMLVSANVDTNKVSVISIPRDTRVDIPGVGLTKITHASVIGENKGGVREGTLETARAVSNLLGVTLNYYVKIDFEGFQNAVDAIGGIDVTLPKAVNDDVQKIYLKAGTHHLTGDEALRLSRARYGLSNGDFGRQEDQFHLLSALAQQMLSVSNITRLPNVLNTVHQELMDTNFSVSEMAAMGLRFKGISKDDMNYYQLPGKGISAHDPLVGANVYYYEPDMDGVKKVVRQAFEE